MFRLVLNMYFKAKHEEGRKHTHYDTRVVAHTHS